MKKPWKVVPRRFEEYWEEGDHFAVVDEDGDMRRLDYGCIDEAKAITLLKENADLISAAPEMLEALKDAIACPIDYKVWILRAQAAVDKAEGKS